ncbi:hypothetical protein ILUMI_09119, partial [Ignelater luminosus]
YGNLAPTTTITRIFMIFYGIIGIPMNGIVIITLGDFFAKSFVRLYDRWKTLRVQHALATLGLVGQVALYLLPGFTFFIFLPSICIMYYEGWAYDVAVAYAFVTLTTIGFGDYVAGMHENGYGPVMYTAYKIFLLFWIISGLGYLVMVLGFVSRGMKSKQVHEIEHKIASNLKKTNHRIREELRSLLNEYLLMRVKRVYREKFIYVPSRPKRSQSCPDLTIYRDMESPTMARKRALSACIHRTPQEISRIQSDTDLERIDKEKTFKPSSALAEPSQLLLRVVNALGNYETLQSTTSASASNDSSNLEGIDMFPSSEILASERYGSGWSIGSQKLSAVPPRIMRPRAASECKQPMCEKINIKNNDLTWYGPSATKRLQELREQGIYGKSRSKTLPPLNPVSQPQSFFARLRNTFKPSKDSEKPKNIDVEAQASTTDFSGEQASYVQQTEQGRKSSAFSIIEKDHVLEETSIADFLRALTAISVPEINVPPKRKLGTASLTPPQESPPKTIRAPIRAPFSSRRSSLIPASPPHDIKDRRFSLRPEPFGQRDIFAPPPPYCPFPETASSVPSRMITRNRRFSLRPVTTSATASPVQRHALRLKQTLPQDPNFKNTKDDDSTA